MKVYLHGMGCWGRLLDAQKQITYFAENECEMVDGADNADTILYVTCSVDTIREDRALKGVKKI